MVGVYNNVSHPPCSHFFMAKEIIIVTSRLDIGGVAKSSCLLANNLCKEEYNVSILRFSPNPSKIDLDKRINIFTITGPDIIAKLNNSILKKIVSVIFNLRIYFFLLAHRHFLVIAFRTDIILLLSRYKKIQTLYSVFNKSKFKS